MGSVARHLSGAALGVQRGTAELSVTVTSRDSSTRDLPRMTRVGTVDVISEGEWVRFPD